MFLQSFITPVISDDFLQLTNERRFKVNVNTSVSYKGIGDVSVDLFLGILQSNEYQNVQVTNFDVEHELQEFGYAGDSCVYYDIDLGPETRKWRKELVQQSYEISVHDVKINFDLIDSIYAYDQESTLYQSFTASNPPFIDTENSRLQKVADSLWSNSNNALDYARKCYEYVPTSFQYLNPISGFHTLENILAKGGGDCGNLSSVFITLLRMKGIPSRHLVGFRPDNSLHVWADFFLEKYGWIPVDVTYKQSDPEGDYFGNITFKNNGFILHRGIGNVVKRKAGLIRIVALQTYSYSDTYSLESSREAIIRRNVEVVEMD